MIRNGLLVGRETAVQKPPRPDTLSRGHGLELAWVHSRRAISEIFLYRGDCRSHADSRTVDSV